MEKEFIYHGRCEKLTIELKQCSSNPHWKYALHHAYQAKYDYELGIEIIEMK